MDSMSRLSTVLSVAAALAACVACSKRNETTEAPAATQAAAPAATPAPTPEPAPSVAPPASAAPATPPPDEEIGKAMAAKGITGTITADPDPIKVCDKSGVGETMIKWNAKGTGRIQVRIGAPDGSLLAFAGPVGKQKTGKWVNDGGLFYLQEATGDAPADFEHTIARLRVKVVDKPCP